MLLRDTISPNRAVSTPVRTEDLLTRICVRPPYFALQGLRFEPGHLQARVSAERPQGPELGAIQGAELSRHAAIAGLSVAALSQDDDQRRYYLAQQAHFEGFPSEAPYGSEVELDAELLTLSKREARARVTARSEGQVIAVVEVLYSILTDAAFSRLFRSRERPAFGPLSVNAMPDLPAGDTSVTGGRWTREVPEVPEAACAGHFERYPAMPVAILMGQLCQLAGQALGGPYVVADAEVDAHDFCWAGEAATFEVRPVSSAGPRVVFECQASASGRPVGRMTLTLYRR